MTDKMIGRLEVLPDPLALARHVAEWMTTAANAAKGSFRVSLSGGSTPKTLYGLLASDEFRGRFPWQRVSWYWGDERWPLYHPREFRMTRVRARRCCAAAEHPSRAARCRHGRTGRRAL
jgi:6-phosphogluconolactonase